MNRLTKKQVIEMVALAGNTTKKETERILDAYHLVIETAMLDGYEISLGNIAILKHVDVCGKDAKVGVKNHLTGGFYDTPIKKEYCRPKAKFKKSIKEKMRKATEGNQYHNW